MALLLPGLVIRPDLHSPQLLWEMQLYEEPQEQHLLVALVRANLETLLAILRVL
jgi:hypothetical protein